MGNEAQEIKTLRDTSANRRLNILKSFEICKKLCPMNMDILVSNIEFETGLTEKTARSYLKILYDTKRIGIDSNIVKVLKEC